MGIIKNSKKVFFAIFLILSISVGPVRADRRYVSDTLIISLREGKGREFKIIRSLKTDTPLEVLEESGGYVKVRTEKGEIGWVGKQYLTSDPPKILIIAGLKKDEDQLKARVEELEKDKAILINQINDAKFENTAKVKELEKNANNNLEKISLISEELTRITEKYNTLLEQSKHVVDLKTRHNILLKENIKLNKQTKSLLEDNKRLRDTVRIRWFLVGAGVLLIGWLAGKLTRKKKYY